jgi:hypothetical protein
VRNATDAAKVAFANPGSPVGEDSAAVLKSAIQEAEQLGILRPKELDAVKHVHNNHIQFLAEREAATIASRDIERFEAAVENQDLCTLRSFFELGGRPHGVSDDQMEAAKKVLEVEMRKLRARDKLEQSVGHRDPEAFRKALIEGDAAGIGTEDLLQMNTLLKTAKRAFEAPPDVDDWLGPEGIRQRRDDLRYAIAKARDAAGDPALTDQALQELEAALSFATSTDLGSPNDVAAARCLHGHMTRTEHKKAAEAAKRTGDIAKLRSLVRGYGGEGAPGLDDDELAAASAHLAQIEARSEARSALAEAALSNEYLSIIEALSAAEQAGLDAQETDAAQSALPTAKPKFDSEWKSLARTGDIDQLKVGTEKIRKTSTRVSGDWQHVVADPLREVEARLKLLNEVKQALLEASLGTDAGKLRVAVEAAKTAGLDDDCVRAAELQHALLCSTQWDDAAELKKALAMATKMGLISEQAIDWDASEGREMPKDGQKALTSHDTFAIFANKFMLTWRLAPGTTLQNLLRTLQMPGEREAHKGLIYRVWEHLRGGIGSQFEHQGFLLFVAVLYSQEAKNIDKVMGWPSGAGSHNLPVPYKLMNVAARLVGGEQEANNYDPRSPEAAVAPFASWVKVLACLSGASVLLRDASIQSSVAAGIRNLEQRVGKSKVDDALQSFSVGLSAWPDLLLGGTSVGPPCLFCGLDFSWDQNSNVMQTWAVKRKGDSVFFCGLRSMSLDPKVAAGFLKEDPTGSKSMLLVLEGLERGLPLWHCSQFPAEMEIVVPCLTRCTLVCDPMPQTSFADKRFLYVRARFVEFGFDDAFISEVQADLLSDDRELHQLQLLANATKKAEGDLPAMQMREAERERQNCLNGLLSDDPSVREASMRKARGYLRQALDSGLEIPHAFDTLVSELIKLAIAPPCGAPWLTYYGGEADGGLCECSNCDWKCQRSVRCSRDGYRCGNGGHYVCWDCILRDETDIKLG